MDRAQGEIELMSAAWFVGVERVTVRAAARQIGAGGVRSTAGLRVAAMVNCGCCQAAKGREHLVVRVAWLCCAAATATASGGSLWCGSGGFERNRAEHREVKWRGWARRRRIR